MELYNPLVPWHLWGNAEVLKLDVGSGILGSLSMNSVQLVKVNYGRPESWRFLFTARILEASPINNDENIVVDFDLTVGIGRFSTTLGREDSPTPGLCISQPERTRGFARFHFVSGAGPVYYPVNYAWLTNGWSPLADASNGTNVPRNTEVIVAQDIQCRVRAGAVSAAGNPAPVRIQVAAYFAPNVHIRPDWLADGDEQTRFRGNEIGGT